MEDMIYKVVMSNIWLYIMIAGAVIVFGFAVYKLVQGNRSADLYCTRSAMFSFAFACALALLAVMFYTLQGEVKSEQTQMQEKLAVYNADKDAWTIYLDGEEVDHDIDIQLYKSDFDMENKVITLTRQNNNFWMMPIVLFLFMLMAFRSRD